MVYTKFCNNHLQQVTNPLELKNIQSTRWQWLCDKAPHQPRPHLQSQLNKHNMMSVMKTRKDQPCQSHHQRPGKMKLAEFWRMA